MRETPEAARAVSTPTSISAASSKPAAKGPKSSPPCIDRSGPHWCLSNGTPVAAEVAAIIIETPEVAAGDDVLFAGIAAQTFVIKGEKS